MYEHYCICLCVNKMIEGSGPIFRNFKKTIYGQSRSEIEEPTFCFHFQSIKLIYRLFSYYTELNNVSRLDRKLGWAGCLQHEPLQEQRLFNSYHVVYATRREGILSWFEFRPWGPLFWTLKYTEIQHKELWVEWNISILVSWNALPNCLLSSKPMIKMGHFL